MSETTRESPLPLWEGVRGRGPAPRAFTTIAFTDGVKAAQSRHGTREHCAAVEQREPANDALSEQAAEYIRRCDSFLLGTVGSTGWPYIQHRGGPPGFLRVLDPRTLAFANYAGNRQYITLGNLDADSRVFLFLLNYREQRRLKIWGNAEAVADPDLLRRVTDPDYPAQVECAIRVRIAAWDFNCRQHIPHRELEGG